jgi:5-methylcytosine-specific restriction endonuclease McrA
MKQCKRCTQTKNRTDFFALPSAADGLQRICKKCSIVANSINRRKVSGRYSDARWAAKRRGFVFDIPKEAYAQLINKACHYCGLPLNPTGTGLDRVDSLKGYVLENVVPCCGRCNQMKNNLSTDDFFKHLGIILSLHQSRK